MASFQKTGKTMSTNLSVTTAAMLLSPVPTPSTFSHPLFLFIYLFIYLSINQFTQSPFWFSLRKQTDFPPVTLRCGNRQYACSLRRIRTKPRGLVRMWRRLGNMLTEESCLAPYCRKFSRFAF